MAFQLHIRQNLESAGDHFGPGQVRPFDVAAVRVGSGVDCECRIDDPQFMPCHLVLRRGTGPYSRVTAVPQEGAPTFLNRKPLSSPTLLCSGDELRVGHWTLRFQRLHARVGLSGPFSLMSNLAKVALGLVIAAEVLVVVWLPRRVVRAAVWEPEIARYRVTDLLDGLRRRNRPAREMTDFERTLRLSIDQELKDRASYMTRFGDRLSPDAQRRLHDELLAFGRLLDALDAGSLPPALPALDLDSGVRAVLAAAQKK